jgi:hypothetical protein
MSFGLLLLKKDIRGWCPGSWVSRFYPGRPGFRESVAPDARMPESQLAPSGTELQATSNSSARGTKQTRYSPGATSGTRQVESTLSRDNP